jgi:hypothetical protein
MEKRLCIAVLLLISTAQAAEKKSTPSSLAEQCKQKIDSRRPIMPSAIQVLTPEQIAKEVKYFGRTPADILVMKASSEECQTKAMRSRAVEVSEQAINKLTQLIKNHIEAQKHQDADFSRNLNNEMSRLATVMTAINNNQTHIQFPQATRVKLSSELNKLRTLLAETLYGKNESAYSNENLLAAGMNLVKPRGVQQKVQADASFFASSVISQIAAARRAAKAQAAQAAEAATLAAAAAAVASTEQTAETKTTK